MRSVGFSLTYRTVGLNSHVCRSCQTRSASLAKIPALQRAGDDRNCARDRSWAGVGGSGGP